ncbi:hypothetical protein LPJ56_000530 [Coemansia sp. RSA 2599]|nr:hypothetical protein LPJ75_000218 [Coemansia sp. RSA 2598]KAJ1829228.1 hypothetical protein LPJ56_000530 [Coemansia sp. RSA 2599]
MFEFIYRIWIINQFFLFDYSRILRPIFNFLDTFGYVFYRPSGCYGTTWDHRAKVYDSVLRLEIIKGKDIPRTELISTFSQYIHIRVSGNTDYCSPVTNTDNEPKFRMISYFNTQLYSNTIIEISLCNDGVYRDKVVGRVTIPLKELHDVRTFHGWIPIDDLDGNPAGYLYLASKLRMSTDGEFNELKQMAEQALDESKGEQWIRAKIGRSRRRVKAKKLDALSKSSSTAGSSDERSSHGVGGPESSARQKRRFGRGVKEVVAGIRRRRSPSSAREGPASSSDQTIGNANATGASPVSQANQTSQAGPANQANPVPAAGPPDSAIIDMNASTPNA